MNVLTEGVNNHLSEMEDAYYFAMYATLEGLRPLATPAWNVIVRASEGAMGDFGDFLAEHKALIPVMNALFLVTTLSACAAQAKETPVPTFEPTKVVEPTIEVKPTGTAVNISTEVPPGSGGLETEAMRTFKESERGKEQEGAFREYVKYWEKFGLFAPGVDIWLTPLAEASSPNDPNLMLYVAEVNDPNFEGMVFTIPYAQMQKYVETGDADYLLPPQDANYLLENTDPFRMSKQVREGSVPASLGIPVGSILKNVNQDFVYVDAKGRTVGELNEKAQWEKTDLELVKSVEGDKEGEPKAKRDKFFWEQVFFPLNLDSKYFQEKDIDVKTVDDLSRILKENGGYLPPSKDGNMLTGFGTDPFQRELTIVYNAIPMDKPLSFSVKFMTPDEWEKHSIPSGLLYTNVDVVYKPTDPNCSVKEGIVVIDKGDHRELTLVVAWRNGAFDLDGNKFDGSTDQIDEQANGDAEELLYFAYLMTHSDEAKKVIDKSYHNVLKTYTSKKTNIIESVYPEDIRQHLTVPVTAPGQVAPLQVEDIPDVFQVTP